MLGRSEVMWRNIEPQLSKARSADGDEKSGDRLLTGAQINQALAHIFLTGQFHTRPIVVKKCPSEKVKKEGSAFSQLREDLFRHGLERVEYAGAVGGDGFEYGLAFLLKLTGKVVGRNYVWQIAFVQLQDVGKAV